MIAQGKLSTKTTIKYHENGVISPYLTYLSWISGETMVGLEKKKTSILTGLDIDGNRNF